MPFVDLAMGTLDEGVDSIFTDHRCESFRTYRSSPDGLRRPGPLETGCGWSSWRASGRSRSAGWCCPTWAPTSCGSTSRPTSPRPIRRARRAPCSIAGGVRSGSTSSRPRASRSCCDSSSRPTCSIEGYRPGRRRAARHRPRRLPRPQPAARLRAAHRLGPRRSARRPRRTRHRLHRAGRRAQCLRAGRRAADAAAQHRRRLRGRRPAARLRHRLRAREHVAHRRRVRSSTPRWSTAPRC